MRQDCAIDDHLRSSPHLFRELVRTHQALIDAFDREVGMSPARVGILRELAVHGEMGGTELARALGVTAAMVTRRVQELERDGLVARRADERDGRRTWLSLSDQGRAFFEVLHERAHAIEHALAEELGQDDLAAATRVLAALRAVLEARRPGVGHDEPRT